MYISLWENNLGVISQIQREYISFPAPSLLSKPVFNSYRACPLHDTFPWLGNLQVVCHVTRCNLQPLLLLAPNYQKGTTMSNVKFKMVIHSCFSWIVSHSIDSYWHLGQEESKLSPGAGTQSQKSSLKWCESSEGLVFIRQISLVCFFFFLLDGEHIQNLTPQSQAHTSTVTSLSSFDSIYISAKTAATICWWLVYCL